MTNRILNLNDKEIHWLKNKFDEIDVQKGCPFECIICGYDAPSYNGSMPWNKFMKLMEGINQIKETTGIKLLKKEIIPFKKSDPMYYKFKDGQITRTITDIIQEIVKIQKSEIVLTTSGWNSNIKYIQQAAEDITQLHIDKKANIHILYSIKTVSKQIITEYDKFLNNPLIKNNSLTSFIKNSKYTKQVRENIITLQKMNQRPIPRLAEMNIPPFVYQFQYISSKDLNAEKIKEKYSPYLELFSEKYINKLLQNLKNSEVKPLERVYKRAFLKAGRAVREGLEYNLEYMNVEHTYNVAITSEGILNIYFGPHNTFDKQLILKEEYEQFAKKKGIRRSDKEEYLMLASLQGRRLLD